MKGTERKIKSAVGEVEHRPKDRESRSGVESRIQVDRYSVGVGGVRNVPDVRPGVVVTTRVTCVTEGGDSPSLTQSQSVGATEEGEGVD